MPTERELAEMMRKHQEAEKVKAELPDDHDWSGRWNELPYCVKCGAMEGGTPTQCPGKSMGYDLTQAVYHGRVDFRKGKWTNQPSARGMPHEYGAKREPYVELDDVMEYIKPCEE